jgi:hypothetical protein
LTIASDFFIRRSQDKGENEMGSLRFAGIAGAITCSVSACVEPPVKPIPDSSRRSVLSISGDVSGVKDSDTSKLGARGADEGGRLGALQGAAEVSKGGSLLGVLLMPVGAAVGGAKGAAEAQSTDVVDETRSNLRIAIQETDFTELLRSRLAASKAAGDIEIVGVTTGASTAPRQGKDGPVAGHVVAVEYRMNIYGEHLVNPDVGIYVRVTAQVQSPDRRQMIHKATWSYCGERQHFVQLGANKAAVLRAQIDNAAAILAEAIPYDLYVSNQPRKLAIKGACMDFSDLPSGIGKQPGPARS